MARSSERKRRGLARPAPLTAEQRRALAGLKRAGLLDGVYLAGGAAVSHHLGHRISNDLDLFTVDPELDLDSVRLRAVNALEAEAVS